MLLLNIVFALSLSSSAEPAAETPPPGLVHVRGGRITIGSDVKDVEEIFLDPKLRGAKNSLIAETPQHTVKVDDFFLMLTEVTNEQFAEYVKSNPGAVRPPESWGKKAIDTAQIAYVREIGEKKKAARDRGESFDAPEFSRSNWWTSNWASADWAVPKGTELKPVNYVDYQAAEGYARWAGLRLMTEYEYQTACRGKSSNLYPWGNDWDDKRFCASVLYGQDDLFTVGSFPDGASPDGIFDLAGNVWEWTSSPFVAFPKYEPYNEMHGKGRSKTRVEALADFDSNQRVAVGGSFKNGEVAARCTTRRETDRFQATDAVGFRCAASMLPGQDVAAVVLKNDIPGSARPDDVEYRQDLCLAMDRWPVLEGSRAKPSGDKKKKKEDDEARPDGPPEGYQVISGYDAVLFVPVERVSENTIQDMRKLSVEENVVHLGVFSSTQKLIQPALEPGSYMVAFRGMGERRNKPKAVDAAAEMEAAAGEVDPTAEDPLLEIEAAVDVTVDSLIFFDAEMQIAAVMPVGELSKVKMGRGSVGEPSSIPPMTPEEIKKLKEGQTPRVPMDLVPFRPIVASPASKKGWEIPLELGFEPGAVVGAAWRR